MSAAWGLLLLPTVVAHGQYVGKVGQDAGKKPVLRATAVYEYTGTMTAPNASRLVPVVVWDGEHYQPGGLYLAKPEPLAIAGGTQYVLEQSGVPAGLFNVGSAAELNGSWVGLGRFAPNAPVPVPKKLAASKKLPTLTGGSGRGKASDTADSETGSDSNGPVLHRKAGSDAGTTPPAGNTGGSGSGNSGSAGASTGDGPTLHRRDTEGSTAPPAPDNDRPTLHKKDAGSAGGSGTESQPGAQTGSSSGGQSSSPDDRPTLHRKDTDSTGGNSTSDPSSAQTSGSQTGTPGKETGNTDADRPALHRHDADTAKSAPPPDADRPTLRRHADASGTAANTTPDPDRPHLRYGQSPDTDTRVLPLTLQRTSAPGAGAVTDAVKIGQVVAVSDVEMDEPHPFRYTWPSPTAQGEAQAAMHGLALHALVTAAKATFGPAAKNDDVLKHAADANGSSFGPAAKASSKRLLPLSPKSQTDLLADPEFAAFELSYGGGVTYVYSAHTAATGTARRYVTVIAQPDFYGKPQAVLAQTTRGDMLAQTSALHLIDAVDANGDHRAELLFEEQVREQTSSNATSTAPTVNTQTSSTQAANAQGSVGRQFALYSVAGGRATAVYTSNPVAQQ